MCAGAGDVAGRTLLRMVAAARARGGCGRVRAQGGICRLPSSLKQWRASYNISMAGRKWDIESIVAMLRRRGGDSAEIEAKAAEGGVPKLGETFCAFSNMPDGGLVICGLDEKTGFRAVDIPDLAKLEASVVSQARNAVDPPAHVDVTTVTFEGKEILLVDVAPLPLALRPSLYRGKAYLRQSDGDYPMSEAELAQLEAMKKRHRPDADAAAVPGTTAADLDSELVAPFVEDVRRTSARLAEAGEEEILLRRRVLTRSGELTLAGLYALGAYPQEFFPWLKVSAALTGKAGRELPGTLVRDFDGPLPVMLDDVMDWYRENLRPASKVLRSESAAQGGASGLAGAGGAAGAASGGVGERKAELEFPLAALGEVTANALVHRSLDGEVSGRQVEIELRPRSLVVTSPGGLWGVDSARLGAAGAGRAVNATLYDICKHVRTASGGPVIEGSGGGLAQVAQAFRRAGLAPLNFVDTGLSMRVIAERP